jgi:TP901 family phage tail tape measure protein
MINLETLAVALKLDSAGFQSGLQAANQSFDSFGSKLDAVSAKAGALGKSMSLKVTTPLLGIGTAAVMTFANFEQAMADVASVTDLTGQEFDQLSALARKLGTDTSYSATESAQAIGELTKAGVSVNDVLDGAAVAAVNLAAATGIAIPDAATIMATSMNIFSIAGTEAATVSDMFAAAANKSAADVPDLSMAMSQAGLVANQFGLDLQDTLGAMALFADNGLRGSDAGTSFKTMLTSLLDPTVEQKAAMENLGLSFFDAQGEFIGIEALAGQLQEKMSGLSMEERNTALSVLFGSDAIRAATILYDSGAEGVAEYTTAVGETGAASDAAAIRQGTLQGAIERMRGAIDEAFLSLGERLAPTIERVAGLVEQAAERFASLSPQVQTAIGVAMGLAAAIGPLLIVLSMMVPAITGIITVLALLLSPIGLVIAAVALLAVAYTTNFMGMRDVVNNAVGAIVSKFNELKPQIESVKNTLVSAFNTAAPIVREAARLIGQYIVDMAGAIKTTLDGLVSIVRGIMQVIKGVFTGDFELIKSGVSNIVSGMKDLVTGHFEGMKAAINLVVEGIKAAVGGRIGEMKESALSAIANLKTSATQSFNDLKSSVISAVTSLKESAIQSVNDLKERATQAFSALKTSATSTVNDLKQSVISAVSSLKESAINSINDLKERAIQAFSNLKTSATGTINDLKQSAISAFTSLKESVVNSINTLKENAISAFNSLKSQAISAVTDLKNQVVQKALDMLHALTASFTAIKDNVVAKFNEARTAAVTVMTNLVLDVVAKAKALPGQIVNAIGDLGGLLAEAGRDLISGLIGGIEEKIPSFDDVLGGITDRIPDLKGPPSKVATLLYDSGRLIMTGLERGMADGFSDVERRLGAVTSEIGGTEFGGGAVTHNHNYFLTPEALQEIMRDSRDGGAFARQFGSSVGLMGGRP